MRRNINSLFEIHSTTENKQMPKRQDWFSSKEAADYLRIPVGSLRNMVSNGGLKPRGRVGRLNRFHIDDLIELLTRK